MPRLMQHEMPLAKEDLVDPDGGVEEMVGGDEEVLHSHDQFRDLF